MKIGLKYCGGCNPDYDRVALAERIKERTGDTMRWVGSETEGVDLIVAVHGCPTACADLTPFETVPVFSITCPEDADRLIAHLRAIQE